MYNTPSSRTSKHGTARRRNNRNTQEYSLVQAPITTLPECATMHPPPPLVEDTTVDSYEKQEIVVDTPQLDLLHLKDEDELGEFVEEAPEYAVEALIADECGAPAERDGPNEDALDIIFDPFVGASDSSADTDAHSSPYEHREETMPSSVPEKPAPSCFADDGEAAEGTRYGVLSDIMEASRLEEPERIQGQTSEVTILDSPPVSPPRSSGRTRAPVLASRNPTSPSSLSRQLQNVQAFLPTSPQLGFANALSNFAAPRISNVTVSGSSFHYPISRPSIDPFVTAKETRRRSTGNSRETKDRDHARLSMTPHASKSSGSDEEDAMPPSTVAKHTRYPTSSAGKDKVVFASFAALSYPVPSSPPRRLLFVGYENGLQVWDTTHLGEVRELLNRRISGAVAGCSILPAPSTSVRRDAVRDAFASLRPLLGIVVEEHDASYLLVYSLATHNVVKKLDFSGADVMSIEASNSFIVASTTSPFSLHILCSRTLNILHTIQAPQLSIFSRPVSLHTPEGSIETMYSARQDRPHAIFALSSRLLAFASVPPSAESSPISNIYPRTAIPQTPSIQLGSLNVTQADIGNAALKVGGGLLSGMKTLGGIAVAAARGNKSISTSDSGGLRKFFSRSAPAAAHGVRHERRSSVHDQSGAGGANLSGRGTSRTQTNMATLTNSGHITILDLQPLLDDREAGRPERLSDFSLPSEQIVAGLKFSEDGTSLSVTPEDGGIVRLYQIKPFSRVLRSTSHGGSAHGARNQVVPTPERKDSSGNVENHSVLGVTSMTTAPWHLYDLRRGRTSGIIEVVSHSTDGRWVGISTRKRTIHIFATNPYGGKPDDASHTDGRVKNVNEIQPLSTEVRPIVRLRSNQVTSPEQLAVPLAFTFVSFSPDSLPTKFLPPLNTFSPPSSVSSSVPSSLPHRRTQSVSPRLPTRPTNYQDVLTFDPAEGSLSLRRMTISIGEASSSILASLPIPTTTSISLPGIGFMGRTSASPPKPTGLSSMSSATEQLQTEVVAKDSTIAAWNLMRDTKWNDVKEPVIVRQEHQGQQHSFAKSEWLAQAELSTYSRSAHILPSSIYLSHQFSFFALSEDYHALIRRLHFNIPVEKIEVRKEVEASAYVTGRGESFVSAATTPHDVLAGRSLDEPLASAIYSGLEYSGSSPPIIPMLPNGARPGSFKAGIPMRGVAANLTEGVNESLGRLSRGFRKVRSPKMIPTRTDESVPLEFDEEDEAFLSEHGNDNDNDTMSNSGCGRDSQSVSTPSTNNNMPLPDNGPELADAGWLGDMDAVEEAERFDEISAARLMEEELPVQPVPIRVPQKGRSSRKGGKKLSII